VGRKKKILKLRAEFEALDDMQKDYLMGIAKALSFAYASGKTASTPSPPKPNGTVKEDGASMKGGRC
jgi:hypothetical protein